MATNKSKLGLIALLSVLGLTACSSDIMSKPSDYDEGHIIEPAAGTDEIYNNKMNVVYDEIRDGSLASDVLDKLLYEYACDLFGYYDNAVVKASVAGDADGKDLSNVVTLKAAIEDESKQAAFIKAHKAYWWEKDEDGNRVESAANLLHEKALLKTTYQRIKDKIAETMYSKISGGSYSEDNLFNELKFVRELYFDLQEVDYDSAVKADLPDILIAPEMEAKDVFKEGVLHNEYYESDEFTYIQTEVVPSIYRTLLTESYIRSEAYNNLTYSYARKINYISISSNSDFPEASKKLMDAFMGKINGTEAVTLADFYNVSKAWRGVEGDVLPEYAAVLNATSKKVEALDKTLDYYEGTAYGELVRKVAKITSDPLTNKSDIENEFTGSNTYSVKKGFEKELNQVKLKNYVKSKWYYKGGASTGLPSKLETYLFNPSVAKALDNKDYPDRRINKATTVEENKYVAQINGKFYLKNQSKEFGADDILHYDSSSSTYYVIQIEEAVDGSKLSKTNASSYYNRNVTESYKYESAESIIGNVLSLYDDDSSYQSKAKELYLEEMAIEYHDTVIYDYFKTNYPDLFE